jgi:hypothetical protein
MAYARKQIAITSARGSCSEACAFSDGNLDAGSSHGDWAMAGYGYRHWRIFFAYGLVLAILAGIF